MGVLRPFALASVAVFAGCHILAFGDIDSQDPPPADPMTSSGPQGGGGVDAQGGGGNQGGAPGGGGNDGGGGGDVGGGGGPGCGNGALEALVDIESDSFIVLTNKLASDSNGGVYVAGNFVGTTLTVDGVDYPGPNGGADLFTVHVDENGVTQAVEIYGSVFGEALNGLAVDPNDGSVFVGGSYDQTGPFGPPNDLPVATGTGVFVAKLNPDLTLMWAVGFPNSGATFLIDLDVGANGDILIAGGFEASLDLGNGPQMAQGGDLYAARLSGADGSLVWAIQDGGVGDQTALAIVDSPGFTPDDAFIAGSFENQLFDMTTAIESGFIARIERNGTTGETARTRKFGNDTERQLVRDLALDSNNNVVVVGDYRGDISIGGMQLTGSIPNGPVDFDLFAARVTEAGGTHWAKGWGDEFNQGAIRVGVTPDDDITLSGDLKGSINFGGGITADSQDNATANTLVAKLHGDSGDPCWAEVFQSNDGLTLHSFVDGAGSTFLSGTYSMTLSYQDSTISSSMGLAGFVAKVAR